MKHNETQNTKQNLLNSTDLFNNNGPFAPKTPSKVLGPLLVYQNEDNHTDNNVLGPVPMPNISLSENPFYNNHTMQIHDIPKTNKNSTHSNKPLFVTPPPPPMPQIPNMPSQNYFPNHIDDQVPPYLVNSQSPTKSHIAIHGKGNPDELLQFINQHPEIANYPPGSVLEIHNVPPNAKPNQMNPQHNGQNVIPYLIQQNPNINNELPPGITLEQILQEIHKSEHPPSVPYHVPQFPRHDNDFLAQQSGPIMLNRQNITKPGW